MGSEAEIAYIKNSSQLYSRLLFVIIRHHCLSNRAFTLTASLIFVLFLFCQQGNIHVRVVHSRMPVPTSTRKLPKVFHTGKRNYPWKSKANSAEATSPLGPALVSMWYDTSYSRNWDCGDPGEIEIIHMFWSVVMTISVIMPDLPYYPPHKTKSHCSVVPDTQIHCLPVAVRLPLSKH